MNDASAIRRCLAGEREAFRHLVERYEREAQAQALALCSNADLAQDCVQEAFVDAFRNLHQYDTQRPFYPWFFTLLRNRCLKLHRRQDHLREVPLAGDEQSAAFAEAESEHSELWSAMLRLSPAEREILILKYAGGLKYRELAERLSVPLGTVMSRLYQARQNLRQLLDGKESGHE